MRTILKACLLVLTFNAIAVSAQGGWLESGATRATPEGFDAAPASADRSGEVLVSLPSNLSLEVIDLLARRHRLTRLESQAVGLLGTTVHRWSIADGRSMPDVILALKLESGIDAQPNYVYKLQ